MTSNPQIHVRFLRHRHLYIRSMFFFSNSNQHLILKSMSFFKFLNRRQILKSMAFSHFDVTDICPNPNPNQ